MSKNDSDVLIVFILTSFLYKGFDSTQIIHFLAHSLLFTVANDLTATELFIAYFAEEATENMM